MYFSPGAIISKTFKSGGGLANVSNQPENEEQL
jgi:hypothetical protein